MYRQVHNKHIKYILIIYNYLKRFQIYTSTIEYWTNIYIYI